MPLNLNGRICVFFSIFWGLLAIYLISYVNPKIDKLINFIKSKISIKLLKVVTATVTIFLFLDCLITGYALEMFFVRKVHENDLQVLGKEQIDARYEEVYSNEQLSNFIYKFFGDEKMIKTFPNLKVEKEDGKILYVADAFPEIQTEYVKLFTPKALDSANILENIRKNQN